ncbi:MAG: hypothetical protein K2X27_02675 [Candidatus Obscuribacterales bacterium]|nr:hypothetical protein [Candidatus Obscuribacterales bacterium]
MSPEFCDWCGEPALPGNELCRKCAEAQSRVAAGELISKPTSPERNEKTVMTVCLTAAFWVVKGIGLMILGWTGIVCVLGGSCFAIVAVSSVSNPGMAAFYLLVSVAAFALTYGIYWLMNQMLGVNPPRRINKNPAAFGDKPDPDEGSSN